MGCVQSGHGAGASATRIATRLSALAGIDTLCAPMASLLRAVTALACSVLFGLGCSLFGRADPPPGFEPTTSSYSCADFVMEVRFRHPEVITIAGRGEVATLERGAAHAGERFRGEGFTFWTEGEDRAFLQLPAGQIRTCFRIHESPGTG